jgi:hypothetical protein
MNFSNNKDFHDELRASKQTLTGDYCNWTEKESVIVWSCVNICNQDFGLISPFFPDRPITALESFYHIHGYKKVTLTSFPSPDTTSSSSSLRTETTYASQSPLNDISQSPLNSQPKKLRKTTHKIVN